mmetsp:Transcript_19008/g.56986  ORF Transcript_19008/g.56986 Transcript_19008/m.56986 type:complete len:741 (+) Transcript_19008:233-2455(+)
MAANATETAIKRLMREFGQAAGLERDVLESVLEVMGNDVQATIDFLRAGKDDFVDPGPSNEARLPAGYMTPPASHSYATLEKLRPVQTPAQALKSFFLETREQHTLPDHLQRYDAQPGLYRAVLLVLLQQGVELSSGVRARTLTVAWARQQYTLADHLLSYHEQYHLPEVLKSLRVLDGPRRVRQLTARVARLQSQGTARPQTLSRARARLAEARNELFEGQATSVSGALCKRVLRWVRGVKASALEFYALQMPMAPWMELADLIHPSRDAFQLPWYLDFVFGKVAPAGSMAGACRELNADNVGALLDDFEIPYSYLRKRVPQLTPAVAARIAGYERLDTLIWYYEELTANAGAKLQVDKAIQKRLEGGEAPEFSYGKFMERLLYFQQTNAPFLGRLVPVAERRLREISLPLEQPALVLSDASFSMDVAIRTGTIIASLLAVLANAELRFFNVRVVHPHVIPTNAEKVIEVATKTRADGLTAPAVAIKDLYAQRKVVKFIVVVTDEVENEPYQGDFFAQTFYRYYSEVYPAKLVFVSFLEDMSKKGRMVQALESFGIVPLQFRLDAVRPDLTKVDSLLGILASETEHFSTLSHTLAQLLDDGADLRDVITKLRSGSGFGAALGDEAEADDDGKVPAAAAAAAVPSAAATAAAASAIDARSEAMGSKRSPFECPITLETMTDPVVCADGQTYQREAIQSWLDSGKTTSPLTGAPLEHHILVPNYALRTMILEKAEAIQAKK